MKAGEPSRTAWGAAVQRAMHQDEPPVIFADPLAWRILGDEVDTTLWEGSRLRVFIAVRHRFAEDALADAVRRGVRQVVVLGAGLDTFAHRNPHRDVRVWEVDHPDTQTWKRARVAAAGLEGEVTHVPVDFESESFLGRLVAVGFSASTPAFFMWLGVVPYLTREAVEATLRAIASVPGAEVVLDYANPVAGVPAHERAEQDLLRERVAGLGEPLQPGWETPDLHALLRACGFTDLEDLGRPEIRARYLGKPPGPAAPGGHVLRAARSSSDADPSLWALPTDVSTSLDAGRPRPRVHDHPVSERDPATSYSAIDADRNAPCCSSDGPDPRNASTSACDAHRS